MIRVYYDNSGAIIGWGSDKITNFEEDVSLSHIDIPSPIPDIYSKIVVNGVIINKPHQPVVKYMLTTDALDTVSPYDGIPDIKCGGESCVITVQKYVDDVIATIGDDLVYITTTAGKLAAQSISLVDGTGSIKFYSGYDTIVADIRAWSPSDNTIVPGNISIQFHI